VRIDRTCFHDVRDTETEEVSGSFNVIQRLQIVWYRSHSTKVPTASVWITSQVDHPRRVFAVPEPSTMGAWGGMVVDSG